MLHSVTLALLFGVSAGFTPGPLFTLVVSETLQNGIGAGIRVAVGPFISDIPIFVVSFLLLMKISDFEAILAVISFCGAFFVAKLGVHNLRMKGVQLDMEGASSNALKRGMLVNLMSPYPYLFWVGIGVPVMSKILVDSVVQVFVFIILFYLVMLAIKMLLVLIVAKSRRFLQGALYIFVMRFLGCVLILFAANLCYDGVQFICKTLK